MGGRGAAERASLIDEVESVLRAFGEVRRRTWGDVVSVELKLEGGSSFSFQVARRSARLSEPLAAPWPRGLRVDSLDDLAAAKMEALVARGAPRDFRDIRALCAVQLATPERLWMLWARRREAAAETADRFEAGLAIRTHLERIQRVRPLENIAVEADRNTARDLRTWFKESLLRGLV